jgi:hypothetical protein
LYLRNFARNPVTLDRVEVLDANASVAKPIATFDAGQLDGLLQPIGAQSPANENTARRQLAAGASAVLFVWLTFDGGAHVPNKLRHRVLTSDTEAEGAVIGTHRTELRVLGPPLKGASWLAEAGPSNDSYHRRGIFVLEGVALIDRRYAIDWIQMKEGAAFSGDEFDNRSHYAYDEEVLAVAAGKVVTAKDGIPDNVPNREGFHPAVPISMETLAGNTITLDVGGGQFAYYMHLRTGSLRVKAGDHVKQGQVLARIGNSGDSRRPHLHFEVTTSPRLLAGEGVPYLIDRYRIKLSDDSWQIRSHELPLNHMLVEFAQAAHDSN